jgi:flavin-dependent dehydrogenase
VKRSLSNADFCIIGGGPSGLAVAGLLAKNGADVALLLTEQDSIIKAGEFIHPSVKGFVNSLNLLDQGWELQHLPVRGFENSWGKEVPDIIDYIYSPHGHGLSLDRLTFERQLLNVAKINGARVVESAYAENLKRNEYGHWVTTYRTGSTRHEFISKFLFLATGRASKLLPSGVKKHRYDRLAFLAVKLLGETISQRPFIDCFENGWVYFTPLPQQKSAIYIFFDPHLGIPCERSIGSMQQKLIKSERLQELVVNLSDEQNANAQWFAGPANSALASASIGQDWALLGDHAEARDPLSASGIYYALKDAKTICDLVVSEGFGATRRSEFEASRREGYNEYLRSREAYYSQVSQWKESEFWRRSRSQIAWGTVAYRW